MQEPSVPVAGNKRKMIAARIVLALIVVGLLYWLLHRGQVSTDDGQVEGDLVPVSSRVSGYVASIGVDDNQQVNAGYNLLRHSRTLTHSKFNQYTWTGLIQR